MTVNPRTDRGIDRDAWVNLQIRNQTLPNTLNVRTPKLVDKLRRVFYRRFEDPQERIVEGAVARAENLNATGDVYGRTPGRGPWAMEGGKVGRTPANWRPPIITAQPHVTALNAPAAPGIGSSAAAAPPGSTAAVVGPSASAAPTAAALPVPPGGPDMQPPGPGGEVIYRQTAFLDQVGALAQNERRNYITHQMYEIESGIKLDKAVSIPLRVALGPGWEPTGEMLGSGGFGVVRIFFQLDDDRMITDRVLVKDNLIIEQQAMFNYVRWHGDVRDPKTRRPMEIWAMQQIHGRPGSRKCTQLRQEFPPEMDQTHPMWYRLFLEYCENDTLDSLILPKYDLYPPGSKRRIPEPALWSLFEDLTEACLLLGHGGVKATEAAQGWEPIYHLDMKPENIFMDQVDETRADFARYPPFRLGDFGLCITTSQENLDNPMAFANMGTLGWRAPEQYQYYHKTTGNYMAGPKIGEWTNVWTIGMVLIAMMNRNGNGFERDDEPIEFGRANPSRDVDAFRDAGKYYPRVYADGGHYSDALKHLAHWCVRYDITDRPSLRQLRRRIRQNTGGEWDDDNDDDDDGDDGGDDIGGERRDAAEGMRRQKKKTKFELRTRPVPDTYRIGFARPPPSTDAKT